MRRFTRRKLVLFAVAAIALSTIVTLVLVLALDIYLHHKFSAQSGLNVWGYRGPAVGRKQPDERRIVMLGGSTTLGYGVSADQAIPAYLQTRLTEHLGGRVTVVNLGYNNEGAHAFRANLDDYAYLRYDVVVLYTGYNDLTSGNTLIFRRASPVFRLTGYLPIFPLIFREKAMALRFGSNIETAYRGEAPRTAFTPTIFQRGAAAGIEAAAKVSESLERQLGRLTRTDPVDVPTTASSCEGRWASYCRDLRAAIDAALARGARVLVAGQPYISDRHIEQQQAVDGMMRTQYAGNPHVKSLNLGHAIDLRDRLLAWDGMHLTSEGNGRIAGLLTQPVIDLLR